MKAAVLSGIENLEITEVDRPTCNSGEVLLKLEACAICKTDTKMFHSGHRDLWSRTFRSFTSSISTYLRRF